MGEKETKRVVPGLKKVQVRLDEDLHVLESTIDTLNHALTGPKPYLIHISYLDDVTGQIRHFNVKFKYQDRHMLSGFTSFERFVSEQLRIGLPEEPEEPEEQTGLTEGKQQEDATDITDIKDEAKQTES